MSKIMDRIKNWPRNMGNELIFKSSEDAIGYGALVSNYRNEINKLKYLRLEVYKQIALEEQRGDPVTQKICDLAVKAQFYREAYEEAERIFEYEKTSKKPFTTN